MEHLGDPLASRTGRPPGQSTAAMTATGRIAKAGDGYGLTDH